MILSPEISQYIIHYGYAAVFSLVFLQEIGVPNPVPNEVILIFSGYLASTSVLSFPLLFLAAVSADIIGTTLLYGVFHFFGDELIKHAPRWLPVEKINKVKDRIQKGGMWGIYLGRLMPYVRGYTSVAAGLVRIPPKTYLPAILFSAITWTGGYIIAGKLLGKRWDSLAASMGLWQVVIVSAVIIVLVFFIIPWIFRCVKRRRSSM